MKTLRTLFLLFIPVVFIQLLPAQQRGYYRYPALSGNNLVFTAEGDLWKYNLNSKEAYRLTTHHGYESNPCFSPDGQYIAFVGQYEGLSEIYLIASGGGSPERLSYEESSPRISQWTEDGKILYSTTCYSSLPDAQLLKLDPDDLSTELIPLSQADEGTYTQDGELIFTRLRKQSSHTKRYIGGTAQQIWKFDGNNEAIPLTDDYDGTSKEPMYYNGRIYFLTDRDGTMNIWSMKDDGSDLQQHTRSSGWDLYDAVLDNGRIVCQKGADILLYDIEMNSEEILDIKLLSDSDQKRIQWIKDPLTRISAVNISGDGTDVVVTARGRVFNFPLSGNRWSEITRKYGVRYNNASFYGSDEIIMLSDESGEFEIWSSDKNGLGTPKQLTDGSKNLITGYSKSPDGKYIVFAEKDSRLRIFSTSSGESKIIDNNVHSFGFRGPFSWSPDSKWIAYVINAANRNQFIKVYNIETGKSMALTSDRLDSYMPKFSPDGRWLYFISDRTFRSSVGSPWGSRQPEPYFTNTAKIYAVSLNGARDFPFIESNELDQTEDKKLQQSKEKGRSTNKSGSKNIESDDEEKPVSVNIIEAGILSRLYEVPISPANIRNFYITDNQLLWQQSGTGREGNTVYSLKLSNDPDNKPKSIATGVSSFSVSEDGKKTLIRNSKGIFVMNSSAARLDENKDKLKMDKWTFTIDPAEDWKQMFRDAWRMERDYFYDPGMHGLDWDAVYDKYSSLLPRICDRYELDDLMAQMISELSTLHMFVRGGDKRISPDRINIGFLGAKLRKNPETGYYSIEHIYMTDPDYPGELSPLARPHMKVQEGDILLAINGIDLSGVKHINEIMAGRTGMQVRLKLKNDKGSIYEEIVSPVSSREFSNMRYSEWEYNRAEEVDKKSDKRIGYVHLRAMGGGNYSEWVKGFYPNYHKEGLIVDVRHNRGGNIDSWVLEKLMRKAWFYWAPRVGNPYWNMQYAFRGHMVVLVDENTASDGEAFAEGFRRLGMGVVIGRRTWGGEVWLSQRNRLVDNGIATAAETGVYSEDGEWLIEGYGVIPDVEVDNLPHASFKGEDTQLNYAINYLLKRMEDEPVVIPPVPDRPDKSFNYKIQRSEQNER